ncbi:MAG: hypothetical protein ACK4IY_02130, partial [Chitinophagales bacterium]
MSGKPEVHAELEGFEMGINEFGEITSNMSVDKINKFLNKHVDDKKFRELENIPYAKKDDDDEDDDDDFDDSDDDMEDEFEDEFDEEPSFDEDLEDLEDLVNNMGNGKGMKDDDDLGDLDEEEFLDEYA